MDMPPPPRPVIADVSLGPAYLMKSRSHALPYLFKPLARAGARIAWTPRLELGGDLVALVEGSEHYRIWGAMARARYAVWNGERASVGVSSGLGLGHDADILHADLRASRTIAPYGMVGTDMRWSVAGRWLIGVELVWQNLAVAHLGAVFGCRWGDAR